MNNLAELMKKGSSDAMKIDGFCSNEEMQNDQNAIRFDEDKEVIPDIEKLTETIISFLQYINTDEMVELDAKDHTAFIRHLEEKFEDFTLNYYNMFKMLVSPDNRDANVMKLLGMLEVLSEIKSGQKDMTTEFEKFREAQAEEYIYPQFGSKAKFEEAIVKRAKKKQRKAHK